MIFEVGCLAISLSFLEKSFWLFSFLGCLGSVFFSQVEKATSYGSLRNSFEKNKSVPHQPPEKKENSSPPGFLSLPSKWAFFLFYFPSALIHLISISYFISSRQLLSSNELVLPFCLTVHFLRRLSEVLWVHKYSSTSFFPFLTWVSGFAFYLFLFLSWFRAPFFRSFSSECSLFALNKQDEPFQEDGESAQQQQQHQTPLVFLGLVCFTFFSAVQNHCHVELASLREKKEKSSAVAYPSRCLWFRLVTCPHYFAECGIYLSFLILPSFDSSGLLCAFVFTFTNLFITSRKTLQTYQTRGIRGIPNHSLVPFFL